ncbi:MAG: hypothetical protein [Yanbian Rhabd tick virus 3]|uniref:Uncharacterized protein n=1 Tax=Yanbian Rhabd tick virus 3 TaxID=2972326 RepID=A0A9E7V297_9RHAB|nr:MAG: hypothetical protein [Yanbian Rhabd tick virus 3]WAK77163.1 MAG: hypothetical protein [Rhabdoviridae sp.]
MSDNEATAVAVATTLGHLKSKVLKTKPSLPYNLTDDIQDGKRLREERRAIFREPTVEPVTALTDSPSFSHHYELLVADRSMPEDLRQDLMALRLNEKEPAFWYGAHTMWTYVAKSHFAARHLKTEETMAEMSKDLAQVQKELGDYGQMMAAFMNSMKMEGDRLAKLVSQAGQQQVLQQSKSLRRPALPQGKPAVANTVSVRFKKEPDGGPMAQSFRAGNNNPASMEVSVFLNSLTAAELPVWTTMDMEWLAGTLRQNEGKSLDARKLIIYNLWRSERHAKQPEISVASEPSGEDTSQRTIRSRRSTPTRGYVGGEPRSVSPAGLQKDDPRSEAVTLSTVMQKIEVMTRSLSQHMSPTARERIEREISELQSLKKNLIDAAASLDPLLPPASMPALERATSPYLFQRVPSQEGGSVTAAQDTDRNIERDGSPVSSTPGSDC